MGLFLACVAFPTIDFLHDSLIFFPCILLRGFSPTPGRCETCRLFSNALICVELGAEVPGKGWILHPKSSRGMAFRLAGSLHQPLKNSRARAVSQIGILRWPSRRAGLGAFKGVAVLWPSLLCLCQRAGISVRVTNVDAIIQLLTFRNSLRLWP